MRILQLLGHGSVGGTETFVVSLVQGLIDRGHDVTLVNTWTQGPFNALAESSDIPFVRLCGGARRIGPRWFWVVNRYLRRHRFDVVHTYGLRVSLGLRVMQRRLGVGHHVMGVRGLDQQRSGLQARVDRLTENRLDLIVCNAHAVAEKRVATVGTPRYRICVIPNGIDLEQFRPTDQPVPRSSLDLPDGFLFANVASFRVEKDHENLIEAVRLAGARLAGSTILLIGTGRRRDVIGDSVREAGMTDRFMFIGPAEDVRPYLGACDAFVLSSFSEGMPRAVMEAMAMGLPVVSTAAGGVPEVAEHEKHALLVRTRSPQALADAMVRIVRDADLRLQLAQAGAKRIRDHFSRAAMLDGHVEMYESVLGRRPTA